MTTPYDDPPTDSSLSAAEAAHLAARDTVALDLERPAGPARRPFEDELANMPTVRIPLQRRGGTARRGAPLAVAALVNTAWATMICLLPVLLLVVLAERSAGGDLGGKAPFLALGAWLLAHGVPLTTTSGSVLSIAPLAVTMVIVWRLGRAGVHTSRGIGVRGTGSVRHAVVVALSVGAVHTVFGVVTALAVRPAGLDTHLWQVALHFAGVGSLSALSGSIRATGALRRLARDTPLLLRDGLRTGAVAALGLWGAGAGVIGLTLALRGGEAAKSFDPYPDGVVGQIGVTVICLAFAPNFAMWAASYLVGPGFMLGAGVVRAGGGADAAVPPLPVAAALPDDPLQGAGWLLLALPLLTGIVSAALLVRRRLRPRRSRTGDTLLPRPRWGRMAAAAAAGGPIAGVLLAAASYASGGAAAALLPRLGPVPWQTGLAGGLVITLGGLLGVAGSWVFQQRTGARRRVFTKE